MLGESVKQSNPRTIHALLTDQPKTRKQLSEESGLNTRQVRFAIRGMLRYGQCLENLSGVTKGPNGFRKQWASTKEKQRHYAKEYRKKAQADTGEMGRKFRETQKRNDAKRIRAITAKVRAHNAQAEKSAVARAHKKRMTDALASLPVAPQIERMSVDEWLAAGNQVEVLPSNLGQAYAGLNANRIALY